MQAQPDYVGHVLSAFSIITGITIAWAGMWYTRRNGRKALSYSSWSSEIATVHSDLAGLFRMTFEGIEVKSASLLKITLRASGKVPILPSDFEQPLKVVFRKQATVLLLTVSGKEPADLPIKLSLQRGNEETEEKIIVSPLLLNAGDKFELIALVSGSETYEVWGRIQGTTLQREAKRGRLQQPALVRAFVSLCIVYVTSYVLNGHHVSTPKGESIIAVVQYSAMGFAAGFLWPEAFPRGSKRRSEL